MLHPPGWNIGIQRCTIINTWNCVKTIHERWNVNTTMKTQQHWIPAQDLDIHDALPLRTKDLGKQGKWKFEDIYKPESCCSLKSWTIWGLSGNELTTPQISLDTIVMYYVSYRTKKTSKSSWWWGWSAATRWDCVERTYVKRLYSGNLPNEIEWKVKVWVRQIPCQRSSR